MALAPVITRTPYDTLAAAYDAFADPETYERWIGRLTELAADHGAVPGEVLDVACGSGASFLPLLDRADRVVACDNSAGMLEAADERSAGRAELHLLDMRDLPRLGAFDLVTCIDDALNHLLSEDDVLAALRGMRRNLAPAGVLVFDLNTLSTLRRAFSESWVHEEAGLRISWRGDGRPDLAPGGRTRAAIVLEREGEPQEHATIEERHVPLRRLPALLRAAGLRLLAVHAQQPGAQVLPLRATELHHKAVVLAAPAVPRADRTAPRR